MVESTESEVNQEREREPFSFSTPRFKFVKRDEEVEN
jgi:hypothetical protein